LQVSEEMAGRPDKNGRRTKASSCGKDCKDWQTRARDAMASVKALEADLASLGPPMTVSPKADRMAQLAAVFGGDFAQWKAGLVLVEPFLWTVFFELGSVVSLGFAFGHRGERRQNSADTFSASFSSENDDPTPPRGPRKTERLPANVIAFKHPVVRALESVNRPVTNGELARLMGVSDGEASKRWREVAHLLEVARAGKERRIALKMVAAA
jgi:hypothetical protein